LSGACIFAKVIDTNYIMLVTVIQTDRKTDKHDGANSLLGTTNVINVR